MSTTDILLIIAGSIMMLFGLVCSLIPILPGIFLSYSGILFLHFSDRVEFSTSFLLYWLLSLILVQILDLLIPLLVAKRYGGSRYSLLGGRVGILIGWFFAPTGLVLGPFLGTMLSELIKGKRPAVSIKAGFGSFLAFLLTAVIKLSLSTILVFYFIKALFFPL